MGPKISDRVRMSTRNTLTCDTLVITKRFITDGAFQIDLIQGLLLRILVVGSIRSFDVRLPFLESAVAPPSATSAR
jgi:hypothetical protein